MDVYMICKSGFRNFKVWIFKGSNLSLRGVWGGGSSLNKIYKYEVL